MIKFLVLIETDFILSEFDVSNTSSGSITWKSPSNIALVKYWGKRKTQIPENASISFTLDSCFTETTLEYAKQPEKQLQIDAGKFNFEIYFEDQKKDEFKPKIASFLKRIEQYVPFIREFDFVIKSKNSFPHSSGIASSASGFSALALCIMSLEKKMNPGIKSAYFFKKASFLARLGSGSASRSIQGEINVWGRHQEIEGSSDLFGIEYPYEIHKNFHNYQDTILVVDEGRKQISSSVGHQLMHNHPFAKQRFRQAIDNISKMSNILQKGNLEAFVSVVETEALSLHAMMMTSDPHFILMKPNTLKIIEKIWTFRAKTGSNVCFTLDAGANVHVLFPEIEKEEVNKFIISELIQFCQENHYICDRIGIGATQLSIL